MRCLPLVVAVLLPLSAPAVTTLSSTFSPTAEQTAFAYDGASVQGVSDNELTDSAASGEERRACEQGHTSGLGVAYMTYVNVCLEVESGMANLPADVADRYMTYFHNPTLWHLARAVPIAGPVGEGITGSVR